MRNPQNFSTVIYGDNLFDNSDNLVGENEAFFVQPKAEVCINLDEDEKICVELALNEALSEPTKVRGLVILIIYVPLDVHT